MNSGHWLSCTWIKCLCPFLKDYEELENKAVTKGYKAHFIPFKHYLSIIRGSSQEKNNKQLAGTADAQKCHHRKHAKRIVHGSTLYNPNVKLKDLLQLGNDNNRLGQSCQITLLVRKLMRKASQVLNHLGCQGSKHGSMIPTVSWPYLACCCNRCRSVRTSWVVPFWLRSTAEEITGTGGFTGCKTRGGWGASCFRKLLKTLSLAERE